MEASYQQHDQQVLVLIVVLSSHCIEQAGISGYLERSWSPSGGLLGSEAKI